MWTKIFLILIYVNGYLAKVERSADLSPCPQSLSKYTGSVDELLGNWHVALLIMDETDERFQEQPVCLQGRIYKVNATSLLQIWDFELPQILQQDRTEVDFPTNIVEPGVWLVQSPIGGMFRGTIIDSDGSSYLIIVYCGWQDGNLMHMMTLALSRISIVTPSLKLKLLSTLVRNGHDPFQGKIISWSNC